MNLVELFDNSLTGRSNLEALIYEDHLHAVQTLTFGDLETRSNRLARLLIDKGVGKGDRIAVFLANCVEFIDLYLASVKIGSILVPMNVLYREKELSHIISDASPRAVISSSALSGFIPGEALPDGCEVWKIEDLWPAAARYESSRPGQLIEGDDPALIVYTSGTTGKSKGAVLSHNNLLANTVNLLACWQFTSEDRYLAVLPLFHVHGLGNGVHLWLASGCKMHLAERFEVSRAAELFESFKPSVFFGVPTVYFRLLELPSDFARRAGKGVRLFVSGSAPLPAQTLEDFREMYGGTILERYGMSETMMNIGNPYHGERRPGSVGRPFPGVSVRIVDSEFNDVAEGETGELLVKGPNVFGGYWNRPEASAEAFHQGWFRTGDLCFRSADGYYTLKGRRTDLIISSGFNIYPREIEELILEFPGVREVTVCGVPDARKGEVPVAYVVADPGFDPEAADQRLRASLASFKVPRAFVRVEVLPRTALGKIQKHLLPPWNSA